MFCLYLSILSILSILSLQRTVCLTCKQQCLCQRKHGTTAQSFAAMCSDINLLWDDNVRGQIRTMYFRKNILCKWHLLCTVWVMLHPLAEASIDNFTACFAQDSLTIDDYSSKKMKISGAPTWNESHNSSDQCNNKWSTRVINSATRRNRRPGDYYSCRSAYKLVEDRVQHCRIAKFFGSMSCGIGAPYRQNVIKMSYLEMVQEFRMSKKRTSKVSPRAFSTSTKLSWGYKWLHGYVASL